MFSITETITWGIKKFWTVAKLAGSAVLGRVMASSGIALVTYHAVLPDVKAFLAQKVSGLSPQALAFLQAIGFDIFMVMVLSALVVKIGSRVFFSTVASLPSGTP